MAIRVIEVILQIVSMAVLTARAVVVVTLKLNDLANGLMVLSGECKSVKSESSCLNGENG